MSPARGPAPGPIPIDRLIPPTGPSGVSMPRAPIGPGPVTTGYDRPPIRPGPVPTGYDLPVATARVERALDQIEELCVLTLAYPYARSNAPAAVLAGDIMDVLQGIVPR